MPSNGLGISCSMWYLALAAKVHWTLLSVSVPPHTYEMTLIFCYMRPDMTSSRNLSSLWTFTQSEIGNTATTIGVILGNGIWTTHKQIWAMVKQILLSNNIELNCTLVPFVIAGLSIMAWTCSGSVTSQGPSIPTTSRYFCFEVSQNILSPLNSFISSQLRPTGPE